VRDALGKGGRILLEQLEAYAARERMDCKNSLRDTP
jgi:hypothetical protein